jgi:hypothetical protein
MPAEVATGGRHERADEERESEIRLVGAELLRRPDAHEREAGRPGDRAGDVDGEHRPQRGIDVRAPDEAKQPAEELHRGRLDARR